MPAGRYSITSLENIQGKGLAPRADGKSTHVVDGKEDAVVFSTNSIERAGRYEAAREDGDKERERAALLREEAEGHEKKASQADTRVSELERLEGIVSGRRAGVEGALLGLAGAAIGILGERNVGSSNGGTAMAALFATGGFVVAGLSAKRFPRLGGAVAASLLTVAGAAALRARGDAPSR